MKKQAECENLGDTVKILSVRLHACWTARHSSRHVRHPACCPGLMTV
jgi:hypothetical protein